MSADEYIAFLKTRSVILTRIASATAGLGLTSATELKVLLWVITQTAAGERPISKASAIAETLKVDRSTVSRAISALIDKGVLLRDGGAFLTLPPVP